MASIDEISAAADVEEEIAHKIINAAHRILQYRYTRAFQVNYRRSNLDSITTIEKIFDLDAIVAFNQNLQKLKLQKSKNHEKPRNSYLMKEKEEKKNKHEIRIPRKKRKRKKGRILMERQRKKQTKRFRRW